MKQLNIRKKDKVKPMKKDKMKKDTKGTDTKGKIKSIRTIISKYTMTILAVAILLVGGVSLIANYMGTFSLLNKNMTKTAQVAAEDVSSKLTGYLNLVTELAYDKSFDTNYVNADDIISMNRIESFVKRNGFISATYSDADGVCSDGTDVSAQQYFIDCKKGLEPKIADLVISKETGKLTTVMVAPIVNGTQFKGMIIVVADANMLSDIVKQINIGETGSSYIINKEGDVIAHNNFQMVMDQHNAIELSKKDASYKKIASIEQKMIKGKQGFEKYNLDGDSKILAYAPITGTNGWSIGVTASSSEFMGSIYQTVIIMLVMIVIIMFVMNLIIRNMANIIATPIGLCTDRIKQLALGDLTTEVPVISTQEEGSVLAKEIGETIAELHNVISDIRYCLKEMSEGNFDIDITREYKGDLAPIKVAILDIVIELNSTLQQIQNSSAQVTQNSEQVYEGAQALADGSNNQANSVGEVNATISNITKQIETNSESAQNAAEMVNRAKKIVEQGKDQMMEVVQYMHHINEESNKISNIIKEIEEIADQTNLLSLNAAIEAARAGEAGKGFTVIAENVGNLATKSAEATKSTTELIGNTIQLAEHGNKIADNAKESLERIIDATNDITKYVDKISDDSVAQAEAMSKASKGVEDISEVVEENAATAEESSAISQELTAQMNHLNELVMRFRLRSDS